MTTAGKGAGGPVVLVVDDEPDLVQVTEMLLEGEGCRVVAAENGRRALSVLELVSPDVIVTDMMMPELDGLAFIRAYLQEPGPHAPIVAISGFTGYLQHARELGAAAVIEKPYAADVLTKAVFELARQERPSEAPPAPAGEDEKARLQAVLSLELERPDPSIQPLVDSVAEIFRVPVAGLSAVTEHWQRLAIQCSTALQTRAARASTHSAPTRWRRVPRW